MANIWTIYASSFVNGQPTYLLKSGTTTIPVNSLTQLKSYIQGMGAGSFRVGSATDPAYRTETRNLSSLLTQLSSVPSSPYTPGPLIPPTYAPVTTPKSPPLGSTTTTSIYGPSPPSGYKPSSYSTPSTVGHKVGDTWQEVLPDGSVVTYQQTYTGPVMLNFRQPSAPG